MEPADRAAFLVDAADYFRAFRAAVAQAQKTVFILGWDVHSRCRLIRGDEEEDGLPSEFGSFLNAVAARRRGLNIYVLSWDYVLLYAMDREWLADYKLGQKTHRRIRFHMDDEHPLGSSHHQKIVVVDDKLAFCGGLDLTHSRWDTFEHRPDEPFRLNPEGKPYSPFHDVQMVVDGQAARALGELARQRWLWATGKRIRPVRRLPEGDPWPSHVEPDMREVSVGIARTIPLYEDRQEVREVEKLYEDAIGRAKNFIYIENQYLTSIAVGNALEARLSEPDGPEIVIVVPNKTCDWLEQSTMDVLRSRMLKRLRKADSANRLRLYFPDIPGLKEEQDLNVHSKVMVVDDDLVRVGSSNISNRSMGFDTECDLAIEAGGKEETQAAIVQFRNRLLGEHLGVPPERVGEEVSKQGSLIGAIEHLKSSGRTLKDFEGCVSEDLDALVPEDAVVDREKPVRFEEMTEFIIPEQEAGSGKVKISLTVVLLAGLLGLAAAWRWTPLNDWLQLETIFSFISSLKNHPLGAVWLIGAYLAGGLVAFPVSLLIVVTALAFGPFLGFVYALLGAMLSALLVYGIGGFLGRGFVNRISGSRLGRISRRLSEKGVLAVMAIRLIPVAPFTVVNAVAGVSHIRFRDFALGSLLGLAPGILATVILVDRFGTTLRQPDAFNVGTFAAVVAGVGIGVWALTRWVKKKVFAKAER